MNEDSEKISAERPCPISGSDEAVIVARRAREGHALRNVMSVETGLIYVDPLPVEDLAQFYRNEYRVSYKNTFVPKPKHILRAGEVALKRLGHSENRIQPGIKCLDVGAGGGEWVYLMQQLGCDSVGVEPNEGYGSFARDEYGVEVFLGMHQDAVFERGTFDLVTLYQVLEHLAEPVEDLRSISSYLKPGGLFMIEVPDILFPGMRFDHKWHDGHLYGFDLKTLEATANRAGLKTVSVKKVPGNIFGVFEKVEGEEVEAPSLEDHFSEAKQELLNARESYWGRPETFLKLPRRAMKALREKRVSQSFSKPREILDHAYKGVKLQ